MVLRDEARNTIDAALNAQLSRRNVLRKGMLLGASVPVLASLLAACGDDDDSDNGVAADEQDDDGGEPAADGSDGAEEDPTDDSEDDEDSNDGAAEATGDRHGGHVVIATPNDFVNMWPTFSTGPTARPTSETIVKYEWDGESWGVAPCLAESWEVSEETIIFSLREDVLFHDGTPCDAEAIAWNIDLMRNHPQSIMRPLVPTINEENSAEVIDEFTVQVNLDAPDGGLLIELCQIRHETGISSPAAYEAAQAEAEEDPDAGSIIFRQAVGTGPFKLDEWVTGSHITTSRFEDYWGTDENGEQLPYLDSIRINWVSDDSVRLLEVRSGATDVTSFVRGRDIPAVQDDPELQYVEDPASAGTIHRFFFNGRQGPFSDDLNLRKAVQFAIDREAMAATVGGGLGIPATLDTSRGTTGFDEDRVPYYWYDLEQAAHYREQSDAPAGLEIRLVVIAREVDEQQAQMLQQFLQEIDINVQIELLERAAWGDQVRRNNDFDMATQRTIMRPDAAGLWDLTWSPDDVAAYARPDEPEIWEFLQEARTILDDDERHEAYIELQTMMYEAAWWGNFWIQPTNFLLNKRIRGFQTLWEAEDFGVRTIWVDDN